MPSSWTKDIFRLKDFGPFYGTKARNNAKESYKNISKYRDNKSNSKQKLEQRQRAYQEQRCHKDKEQDYQKKETDKKERGLLQHCKRCPMSLFIEGHYLLGLLF